MGLFSRSYEPGGEHHVRITDAVFDEAQKIISSDDEIKKHFKEVVNKFDCTKYEAHDFPVTEIIGSFFLSYELQEERSGVPENMRIGNIQLGRKDHVEYKKFIEKFNARLISKMERKQADRAELGIGGMLFSMAAGAAVKGIAKVATGKSEDVRNFEKNFASYICGDSQKATDYMLKFASEFGGYDDGVIAVAKAIREEFWISEFAKYNRSKYEVPVTKPVVSTHPHTEQPITAKQVEAKIDEVPITESIVSTHTHAEQPITAKQVEAKIDKEITKTTPELERDKPYKKEKAKRNPAMLIAAVVGIVLIIVGFFYYNKINNDKMEQVQKELIQKEEVAKKAQTEAAKEIAAKEAAAKEAAARVSAMQEADRLAAVQSLQDGKRYFDMGKYELCIEKMKDVLGKDRNNREAEQYVLMAQDKLDKIEREFKNPSVGRSR